jgi:hypothetical protein
MVDGCIEEFGWRRGILRRRTKKRIPYFAGQVDFSGSAWPDVCFD